MDSGLEKGLIGFEYHPIVNFILLVQIQPKGQLSLPSAIGAWPALHSIYDSPSSCFFKSNMSLEFRQKIIFNLNVTGAHSPNADCISRGTVEVAYIYSSTYYTCPVAGPPNNLSLSWGAII